MMSKKISFTAGAVILAVAIAVLLQYFLPARHLTTESQLTRRISYTLIVKNTSSEVLPRAEFSVVAPNRSCGGQQCEFIDADKTFTIYQDDLNNQILQFSFENLPPFAVKVVNIQATVTMQSGSARAALEDWQPYLKNQPELHLENRLLQKQAETLLGATDLETVQNTFNWLAATMSKTGYSAKERGALYALRKKGGDCSEFMHLFIALCRINKIPARGLNGYIVTRDKRLTPDELHDWAEIYLDGQWRLADPYNKVLMDSEEFYIVMRINDARQDSNSFYRWQADDPRLQISMAK